MRNTYYCIRCNFQTDRKSILLNHLNKKNKCKKLLNIYFIPNNILYEMSKIPFSNNNYEYQCKYCLKDYSCKFNLERHKKNCSLKDKKNQNILIKLEILNYLDIKKYILHFSELTVLKYFDKNKIHNSFYKQWNINHIDLLTKKLLYITNDKYSDLLRKILENDKNINIIYDHRESYGYIINDNHDIEIITIKSIVNETMKKIYNTYELFKTQLEENDKMIDKLLLNKEYEIIKDKYNLFINNNTISEKVENIILNIYSDKFVEIQNRTLFELNNKNLGY
jgi:hypothetical protein